MADVIEQIFNITRVEWVLLVLSGMALVQFLIYRAMAQQVLSKQNSPHFPGLSAALADIPARAAARADGQRN